MLQVKARKSTKPLLWGNMLFLIENGAKYKQVRIRKSRKEALTEKQSSADKEWDY